VQFFKTPKYKFRKEKAKITDQIYLKFKILNSIGDMISLANEKILETHKLVRDCEICQQFHNHLDKKKKIETGVNAFHNRVPYIFIYYSG
jgi:hypothetical protein